MPAASPSLDELTIRADAAEASRASTWLEAACQRADVPRAQAERLVLCLDEVLANIIMHGGASALSEPIALALQVTGEPDGGNAAVTVSDSGIAFDPQSAPLKDPPTRLEDASMGGHGLVIVRSLSDSIRYRNEGGRNHLTFGASWGAQVKGPSRTRFRRGPDRRIAAGLSEREAREKDRRKLGIQAIALFRDADPSAVEEALGKASVLSLPAGTPLLRRGESNVDIFVLLSGRLVALLDEEANPDYSIELSPGECIGELSAIDGKPITALVLAATDVRVLRIDRDVFWKQLMLMPGVAQNLLGTLSERMRRSNQKALAMQLEQLELKHLRKELEVARQLQASMLPLQRPLFPGRTDVEVCGFMEPASTVGGDLFDAFFVDARTLFVCIGDVSGHGIAAALFMARVIGLVRNLAMETTQPERVLEALNDRLCSGNSMNLFVTLFCGFLDVETGRLVYSNGGHCAPMVCDRGAAAVLPLPKGMLLGIVPGKRYTTMEHHLAAGETLFCYTDGVTEAEDAAGAQFSAPRCLEILPPGLANPLPAFLDSLFEAVVSHCGSRLVADDCAMLAVRRAAPAS